MVRSIAVLEDDPSVQYLVADLLRDVGWQVVPCGTEEELFMSVDGSVPDVILMDIRLPDPETGWRVLRRLKTDSGHAAVPVIVCSGDVYGLQNNGGLLEKYASAVLVKPFELADLVHAVEHAVAAGRLDRLPVAGTAVRETAPGAF